MISTGKASKKGDQQRESSRMATMSRANQPEKAGAGARHNTQHFPNLQQLGQMCTHEA